MSKINTYTLHKEMFLELKNCVQTFDNSIWVHYPKKVYYDLLIYEGVLDIFYEPTLKGLWLVYCVDNYQLDLQDIFKVTSEGITYDN